MRSVQDREYCCDEHRRRAKSTYSARSLRDEDSGSYETWLPEAGGGQKQKAGFSPGLGVALVVLAAGALLFIPRRGEDGKAAKGERAPKGQDYSAPATGLRESVARAFSGGGGTTRSLRQEFKLDLGNWQSNWAPKMEMASSDWQQVGKAVRVGSLRLWKPTAQMANYNVNFGAQIDNKAVSWAVRAADHSNYYATKLNLQDQGRGAPPKAEIVRYAMVDGKAATKIEMPIPVTLERGKVYDIAMRVSGNKYITSIDGQVVASWSDDRMKRGGVGFFSEPGERATLHYVNVNERESFMQRFLSFSFLIGPWDMPVLE